MFSGYNVRKYPRMSAAQVKKILLAILIVSAILRVGWISRGDTVNDEVYYGFRSVGFMDFNVAREQTTPLEWWDPTPPLWTGLSFHDHPPLVFAIQHLFIKVFGENNFALRLSSALLGIASVYVIFLLGSLIYSPLVGLVSAGTLAVTLNHVYISRTGMQESYVIFFMLLASYLFLKAVRQGRSFIPAGIVTGLAFLTKYNSLILLPIFGTYILFFHRAYLKNKKLWFSVIAAILVFSPVIIYNLMLYRTVGHFDFQFSYIFGQSPKEWPVAPGKEIGSLMERLSDFLPNIIGSNSWIFLVIALVSLFFLRNAFVGISIAYLLILLSVIGPSFRFLTMLSPFLALSVGAFLGKFAEWKKYTLILLIPLAVFEIFYSVNNQIMYYPVGPSPWLSSKVRYENYNWGNNELGEFFKKEFDGKVPALTFPMKYVFLEKTQGLFMSADKRKKYVLYPALIVTEANFDRGAKLWVLDRLQVYHGWPIIDLPTYFSFLEKNGSDYFSQAGFRNYYYVTSSNIVPNPKFAALVEGLESVSITNPRGDTAFKVYIRK